MQWLVRIWRGVLHHDRLFPFRSSSKRGVVFHASEEIQVELICKNNVQKALNHIEFLNILVILNQVLAYSLPKFDGAGFDLPQHGKSHKSNITLEILTGRLKFYRFQIYIKNIFHRLFYLSGKFVLNIHCFVFLSPAGPVQEVAKITEF